MPRPDYPIVTPPVLFQQAQRGRIIGDVCNTQVVIILERLEDEHGFKEEEVTYKATNKVSAISVVERIKEILGQVWASAPRALRGDNMHVGSSSATMPFNSPHGLVSR